MAKVFVQAAQFAAPKHLRHLFTFSVLAACVVLLQPHLESLSFGELAETFSRIPPATWVAAIVATAASFAALGAYDLLIHRWLGTNIPGHRAALSGAAGIGISQTIGFGLFSGTVARARLLPELSLLDAGRITLAVGISFLAALAIVIAVALSVLPNPAGVPVWAIPAGVLCAVGFLALSLCAPNWLPFQMPSLAIFAAVLLATALDTGLAALAFWLLLPEGSAISFAVLVPAFLIALGAGVASGTPAGIGPFEITILALLPFAPEAELLCAIVAFRLVYYAVPAAIAGVGLVLAPRLLAAQRPKPAAPLGRIIKAETGLARQGELALSVHGTSTLLTATTGQCLVAVGPSADGSAIDTFSRRQFARTARSRGLIPALYKCDARTAAAAHRSGWVTAKVAEELWLDPQSFDLAVPSARRLRRKLRAGDKAGLSVAAAPDTLPDAEMTRVANAWAEARGGERGFSMGRYCPKYLRTQQVFLAQVDNRIVGFASFHHTQNEWSLDLLRFDDTAPDGTTYALVSAAIKAARSAGARRFSLAAVQSGATARLGQMFGIRDGLTQFKRAFSPHTEPLYIAAPSRFGLALAGFDIARRIHRPRPLPKKMHDPHESYDNFEFAKFVRLNQ